MNIEYKQFVGFYRNVFPQGYCQHLINDFEQGVNISAGSNRQLSEAALKHMKDDYQLRLDIQSHWSSFFKNENPVNIFFDGLQKCFNDYVENFSTLKITNLNASEMKMQRTSPGGGYHVFHFENDGSKNKGRALVYILYLNTLLPEECGETEFLYQQLRVRPEENMLIIWPADFTHSHRGNVLHGINKKYIVTGWFHFS